MAEVANLVAEAAAFAREAHAGRRRLSGEPYVAHAEAVAALEAVKAVTSVEYGIF
jgi:(p)ppGpp synthase/HD superfamily hydrolase